MPGSVGNFNLFDKILFRESGSDLSALPKRLKKRLRRGARVEARKDLRRIARGSRRFKRSSHKASLKAARKAVTTVVKNSSPPRIPKGLLLRVGLGSLAGLALAGGSLVAARKFFKGRKKSRSHRVFRR